MSGNLADLKSNVAASSADIRTAYFTFLTAGLYLAVTVGVTTHEHLLSESRVPLPLAGVDLPIVGFYVVAPVLFLILHFNLLLQFRLLAGKVHRLDVAIDRLRVAGDRAVERTLLPPFPFVQIIAGRADGRMMGGLLRLTMWLTVVWAPAIVLLAVLAQFLPYHSGLVTWWHRGLIVLDLLLLCLLWPGCLWRYDEDGGWRARRRLGSWSTWLGLGTLSFLLLGCLMIATLPEEDLEKSLSRIFPTAGPDETERLDGRQMPWLTWWLLEHPESSLARNLRLHETSLAGDVDGQTTSGRHDLRGRDLRYAELTGADLRHADLRDASLDGAALSYARLQGALLTNASLKGANLGNTRLEGANFKGAALEDANLRGANLEGANLEGANLIRADFTSAWLLGADLRNATLTRTILRDARLQGAELMEAVLCGATLGGADLEAADLRGAATPNTSLTGRQDPLRSLAYADLRRLKEPPATCPHEPPLHFEAPVPQVLIDRQTPSAGFECGLAERLVSLMEEDDATGAVTIGIGHRILHLEQARTAAVRANEPGRPVTDPNGEPRFYTVLTAAALIDDEARVQRFEAADQGAVRALRALAQEADAYRQRCAESGDRDETPVAESAFRWQPQPSAIRPDRQRRSAPGRSSES